MQPPDQDVPIDGDRVIARLEAQLGAAMGQIARLEAVVATLLEQRPGGEEKPAPRVVSA